MFPCNQLMAHCFRNTRQQRVIARWAATLSRNGRAAALSFVACRNGLSDATMPSLAAVWRRDRRHKLAQRPVGCRQEDVR
jgi:hypothetical protein